jgi:formate dehydrogenase accessory protein FdhE
LTSPGPYGRRQIRADQLVAAYPHAAEMLGLYRRVLALQEPLHDWVLAAGALATHAQPPALALDRLPFPELSAPFRTFAGELAGAVPAALAATAAALGEAPVATLEKLLRHTVGQGSLAADSAALGCAVPHLAFFARAFLQPIAEALAARDPRPVDGGQPACPRCGWPPQVAVLRDELEIKGRRYLVCGLCATWWPFPRTTCPACGESDAEKLPLHESESARHLRIEECATCKAYLKSVDLRRDGFAVPEVDDVASVELDLWSEQRGLWKISRNLLGL